MEMKAPDHEIQAVAEQLRSDQRVVSFRFTDQNKSYSESAKLFSGQRPVFKVQTPIARPTSFQIVLRKNESAAAVELSYKTAPGVDAIMTERANAQVSSP